MGEVDDCARKEEDSNLNQKLYTERQTSNKFKNQDLFSSLEPNENVPSKRLNESLGENLDLTDEMDFVHKRQKIS